MQQNGPHSVAAVGRAFPAANNVRPEWQARPRSCQMSAMANCWFFVRIDAEGRVFGNLPEAPAEILVGNIEEGELLIDPDGNPCLDLFDAGFVFLEESHVNSIHAVAPARAERVRRELLEARARWAASDAKRAAS